MANDSAVRNQKVFVTLASVLQLLEEYNRVKSASSTTACQMARASNNMDTYNAMVARRQGLEFAFRTLDLPVTI